MGKKEIIFATLMIFGALFWGDIVSKLHIPTEYEAYVAAGGGIILFVVLYNWYERKR